MPFDPSKPERFRKILNDLSRHHFLSTEKAIELVRKDRESKKEGKLEIFGLTRSSLDRFKNGKRIKDMESLILLWDVLEKHPVYGLSFKEKGHVEEHLDSSEALACGLQKYFSLSENPKPWHNIDRISKKLDGQYIMYRLSRRLGVKEGTVITALIEIQDSDPAPRIYKTQNFPGRDNVGRYYQRDSGFLFSFSKYVYFLMKEDGGGTTVRMGAIASMMPIAGDAKIDYFYGSLYTTSDLHLYPSVNFYCKRVEPVIADRFETEHISLSEINDVAILECISKLTF